MHPNQQPKLDEAAVEPKWLSEVGHDPLTVGAAVMAGGVLGTSGDENSEGDGIGAANVVAGAAGLSPSDVVSVEPRGMPTPECPDEETGGMAVLGEAGDEHALEASVMPPPSNVPVAASAEVPSVGHPIVLDIELVPGSASSIAPSGIPVGGTAGVWPRASGEAASGEGALPVVCARAKLVVKHAATSAAVASNFLMVLPRLREKHSAGSADRRSA